jgi:hypothetical protein
MIRPAPALLCLTVGLSCARTPPRGPVMTTPSTRARPAAAVDCGDAKAPHLAELCAMGEPSLTVAGPETYRFVWLRHLRNPVAVRVTRTATETAVVTIEADLHDPRINRRHEFTTSLDAWSSLRAHLEAADFWNQAGDPDEDASCLDCADWVIEGRRAGIYHSIVRWNPPPGPFRTACEDLIVLSGLSFPAEIR